MPLDVNLIMPTSCLSETRNQDQQRHRKGILRSGPPICPGIISFVERREKGDEDIQIESASFKKTQQVQTSALPLGKKHIFEIAT